MLPSDSESDTTVILSNLFLCYIQALVPYLTYDFLNILTYYLDYSEAARGGDCSAFRAFIGGGPTSHGTTDYHMSSLLNITTTAIYF